MKHRTLVPLVFAALGSLLLAACQGTDTVFDPPVHGVARIELTPETTAIQTGGTTRISAEYYNRSGRLDRKAELIWESSDAAVASIDESGTVTALSIGQVTITVTAGHRSAGAAPTARNKVGRNEATASVTITVVADPAQVAAVAIAPGSPLNLPLHPGDTAAFTATATNLGGNPIAGKSFVWRSSNPEVATIDTDGLARAVAPGHTDITATAGSVLSPPVGIDVSGLLSSRSGTFIPRPGVGDRAYGTARLQTEANGSLTLYLENDFITDSGPNLHLFISTTSSIGPGSLDLGGLKSTHGAQQYALPSGTTLTTYDNVIVQCVPFNIRFGYAPLGPVQ